MSQYMKNFIPSGLPRIAFAASAELSQRIGCYFDVRRKRSASSLVAIVLSLCVLVSADVAHSQKKRRTSTQASPERRSTEAELAKLRQEIAKVERELVAEAKKERTTAQSIASYDKKVKELRSQLGLLRSKASSMEHELDALDQSFQDVSRQVAGLKQSYEADVVSRYTDGVYRERNEAESFVKPNASSERERQAYYGSLVAEGMTGKQVRLDSTRTELAEDIIDVTESLEEEKSKIAAASKAQQQAQVEKQRKAEELKKVQARKKSLEQELAKRKASAKKLEGIIANLIAKEEAERKAKLEARKKRLAERERLKKEGRRLSERQKREEREDAKPIPEMEGPRSLSWPVGSRRIVQGYGEQRNQELGTVTMNLGIDIGAARGSAVLAAEAGTVASVSSLPGYGSIVILSHGGGLHTVYAELAGVSVGRGERVQRGTTIGTSGVNPELGPIVHFEVWKGRARQNPLRWLK